MNILIKSRQLDKFQFVEEHCFVSPVVLTMKKNEWSKITLDPVELNDSCIKMRSHMLNMEETLSQIYPEIKWVQNELLRISKMDLVYTYGKLKLFEETSRQYNFAITGGNMNAYYKFKKRFYDLSDMSTVFQIKTDQTLNYQKSVWLDDTLIVTRGT